MRQAIYFLSCLAGIDAQAYAVISGNDVETGNSDRPIYNRSCVLERDVEDSRIGDSNRGGRQAYRIEAHPPTGWQARCQGLRHVQSINVVDCEEGTRWIALDQGEARSLGGHTVRS